MKEELQGLLLQAKQMEAEQYERLNTVGHPDWVIGRWENGW